MEMKTKPNRISDLIKTEKKANYKNIPQDERSDKLGSSETKEQLDDNMHSSQVEHQVHRTRMSNCIKFGIVFAVLATVIGIYLYNYKFQVESTFYEIELLHQQGQLALCLVIVPSPHTTQQQILQSIHSQNYTNLKALTPTPTSTSAPNYHQYKQLIRSQCAPYSVIMFVNMPFKDGALAYVNAQLWRNRAWIGYTYNRTTQVQEIVVFYYRVYQLLEINDFNATNAPYLNTEDSRVQAQGFLELCIDHKLQLKKQKIYYNITPNSYFSIKLQSQGSLPSRLPYTKIFRLSQDFQINVTQYEIARTSIGYFSYLSKLGPEHLKRALDRQQLLYLPQAHPIALREYQQYSQKYGIDQHKSAQEETPFCVTVLSRNNIQNNRYLRVLMSIVEQKYENYHIVFIDDNSDDATMNKTIQYMRSINFPKHRVTYVQNLVHNYATYNIINAAMNYCRDDDVQMLIDGDDEFIGRHAFQVMNSAYRGTKGEDNREVWIAYANYKTNFNSLGLSNPYTSRSDHVTFSGKRKAGSFIGPIRTWRVELIRSIPIANHKFSNGNWIDTAYDDSLAHALVQLAGHDRTKYLPEILYEYNTNTGSNDNSNQEKLKHRLEIYNHVLSLPVMNRLPSLDHALRNGDVEKQLSGDRLVKYKTLQS